MVSWLIPISLFWTLAAMYLGGAPINIEGGGGARQIAGLLLHFVVFLVVFAVARAVLDSFMGSAFAVVFASLLAVILIPVLGRVSFRMVGVRITSAEGAH